MIRVQGFEVESELGRGAMGVVYRAREVATGRAVALKVLPTHLARDPVKQARFQSEGQAMAALRHPGIVAIHAAGADGAVVWLACELVEGARTLSAAAATAPLRRRVEWVRDAARALGHAHARGIVHRDVKPENLLVDASGHLRVADFGLALADERERLTLTGQVVGTPLFMAPEQLMGRRDLFGPATDVWALGVTLYELLAGRPPFEADSLARLAALVSTSRPRPPSALAPDVPPDLDVVVLAALSVDPASRPRDGAALGRELDAWLEGRTPAVLRSQLRARGRRRAGLAAAVGVGLALLVAGALLWPAWRERAAIADVEAALEWDGARCEARRRTCARGAHALSRYAFGVGVGKPPALHELERWRLRLTDATSALGPASELREAALEVQARVVAHERLVRRERAGAGSALTSTDHVVEALLLVADASASPQKIDAALEAARQAPDPGASAALARACAVEAATGRRLSTSALDLALQGVAVTERDDLIRAIRPRVHSELRPALAQLFLGDPGAIDEPLANLLEAVGPAEHASSLLSPFERLLSAPAPELALGRPTPVPPQEVQRFWSGLSAHLAAHDRAGVEATVSSLVRHLELALGSGAARIVLRGLRTAALLLAEAPAEALVALRFDAYSARFDPTFASIFLHRFQRSAERPGDDQLDEVSAEALVQSLRAGTTQPTPFDDSRSSLWRRAGQGAGREALRALTGARPWSTATRAAAFLADPRGLDQGLAALTAEVNDLHPRGAATLARTLVDLACEQLPYDDPAASAELEAGLERLIRCLTREDAIQLEELTRVAGLLGQVTLSRHGSVATTSLAAGLLDRLEALGVPRGRLAPYLPQTLRWAGAWLATRRWGLSPDLRDDLPRDDLALAASLILQPATDNTPVDPTMALLLARLLVRLGDLAGAELRIGANGLEEGDRVLIRAEVALARGDVALARAAIAGHRVEPDPARRRRLEAVLRKLGR